MSSLSPCSSPFVRHRTCRVIGAPLCYGQTVGGVEKGPEALRAAGLHAIINSLNWTIKDEGDLQFPEIKEDTHHETTTRSQSDVDEPEKEHNIGGKIKNVYTVGKACGKIFQKVKSAAAEGDFVLTLGGDHGIASGTIGGMLTKYPNLAVIWVDAHGDCNTPATSPSANYHGMPLAHLLGWFPQRVFPGFEWFAEVPPLSEGSTGMIGLRDLDEAERGNIRSSKISGFTMQHVDQLGIAEVVKRVLAQVDPDRERPIHLSFDIDSCDPSIAPGTGTRARGGLTFREVHYILEALNSTGRLVSMDMVEINPDLDAQEDEVLHGDSDLISSSASKTVRLGLDLLSSALGKNIL